MKCRGHYVLVLEARAPLSLRTGRHGDIRLGPGIYLYVGSAHGPGGLRARLERHLCGKRKRAHWHIDKLILAGAKPLLAVAKCSEEKLEEHVASACARMCSLAVPGFGSSDSPGSPGHLFYCPGLGEAVRAAVRCALDPSSDAPGGGLGYGHGAGQA